MRGTLIIADHGPAFHGWTARTTSGDRVCVAPPTVRTDPHVQSILRELITRHGGDCARCAGCIVSGARPLRIGAPPPWRT
ncbi:hypothetical protein ABZY20_34175 [Streptomyces sp. NPDC006624]|uniref:hypothetical protein n=1 Tax=unclassified Streptomyces TaxID=2593676 RepID=UPI0033A7177D